MNSIHPSQTSNDELKAMLAALSDAQSKQSDKTVEILVRLKSQDEKLVAHGTMMANLNQRLVTVEAKAERTARQQEELEGDVLREVSGQATKIDALASETKRQSATLAKQDVQLAELIDDKKQVLTVLRTLKWICAGAPVAVALVTWVITHVKF